MKIHGLTVSVDYFDLLVQALPHWLPALDSLTIVTAPHDKSTQCLDGYRGPAELVDKVRIVVTNAFYHDGAVFNKGKALSEAAALVPWEDWILGFDADILPQPEWREDVEGWGVKPGTLYGAFRTLDVPGGEPDDRYLVQEYELPGFFQLWHVSDPNVQRRPLYDVHWRHAGGYDSEFQSRWSPDKRIKLPIYVDHLGTPGQNWWGRKNPEGMAAMQAERRRLGRVASDLERLPGAPEWK